MSTSLITAVLPQELKTDWDEKHEGATKVPDVDDLIAFLRMKGKSMTNNEPTAKYAQQDTKHKQKPQVRHQKQRAAVYTSSTPVPESSQPVPRQAQRSLNNTRTSQGYRYQCALCPEYHPLFMCSTFEAMSLSQCKDHIRTRNLCNNCLAPGHKTNDCRSLVRCRHCREKHHSMVHQDRTEPLPPPSVASNNTTTVELPPSIQPSLNMTSQVLLRGPTSRTLVVRALLDSGSTATLLSTKAANTLKLPKTATYITFSGVQDSHTSPSRSLVNVTVSSLQPPRNNFKISAAIIPRVTCDLPLQGVTGAKELPHIKGLPLADPDFDKPGRIDLLLREDILDELIIPEKARKGEKGTPSACKTVFGWAIHGRFTPASPNTIRATSNVVIPTVMEPEEKALTRFWEIEEPPHMETALTPEEQYVQKHYSNTHVFLPTAGRYEVTLPKKPDALPLGESRGQALQCYVSNERSLLRKGTWDKFQAVIQEYLDLGHARPVTPEELTLSSQDSYYLPMHGVAKDSSTTTKLHIMFDASTRTTSNVSLNDVLCVGLTLHPTLDKILLKFRTYRVALTGDIGKMYREVQLSSSDRQLHRFLWRADPSEPIQDFCMNRVTFGVASSPYLAVKTLQQAACDHGLTQVGMS